MFMVFFSDRGKRFIILISRYNITIYQYFGNVRGVCFGLGYKNGMYVRQFEENTGLGNRYSFSFSALERGGMSKK